MPLFFIAWEGLEICLAGPVCPDNDAGGEKGEPDEEPASAIARHATALLSRLPSLLPFSGLCDTGSGGPCPAQRRPERDAGDGGSRQRRADLRMPAAARSGRRLRMGVRRLRGGPLRPPGREDRQALRRPVLGSERRQQHSRLFERARGRALGDFESWFYSDSLNDMPLLEKVDHPVAVDPDPTLLAHAESRGWPVISLRSA